MKMKLTDNGCNVPVMPTAIEFHARWYVSSVHHINILHINLLWFLQLYHPVFYSCITLYCTVTKLHLNFWWYP